MPVVGLRTYVKLAGVASGNAGVELELFAVVDDATELLLLTGRSLEWRACPAGSDNWEDSSPSGEPLTETPTRLVSSREASSGGRAR